MDDKTLDNIFKNTFTSKNLVPENEWDEFEVHLYKKMFYKFSWNRFNIYYLSMLLVCFFSSMVLLSEKYINKTHFIENNTTISQPSFNDSTIIDTIYENKITRKTSKKINSNTAPISISKIFDSITGYNSNDKIPKDSIAYLKKNGIDSVRNPSLINEPVVLKRKKTIYFTPPPDTILRIDTIKTKRKKSSNKIH